MPFYIDSSSNKVCVGNKDKALPLHFDLEPVQSNSLKFEWIDESVDLQRKSNRRSVNMEEVRVVTLSRCLSPTSLPLISPSSPLSCLRVISSDLSVRLTLFLSTVPQLRNIANIAVHDGRTTNNDYQYEDEEPQGNSSDQFLDMLLNIRTADIDFERDAIRCGNVWGWHGGWRGEESEWVGNGGHCGRQTLE